MLICLDILFDPIESSFYSAKKVLNMSKFQTLRAVSVI